LPRKPNADPIMPKTCIKARNDPESESSATLTHSPPHLIRQLDSRRS
jgi:hypothetical protein